MVYSSLQGFILFFLKICVKFNRVFKKVLDIPICIFRQYLIFMFGIFFILISFVLIQFSPFIMNMYYGFRFYLFYILIIRLTIRVFNFLIRLMKLYKLLKNTSKFEWSDFKHFVLMLSGGLPIVPVERVVTMKGFNLNRGIINKIDKKNMVEYEKFVRKNAINKAKELGVEDPEHIRRFSKTMERAFTHYHYGISIPTKFNNNITISNIFTTWDISGSVEHKLVVFDKPNCSTMEGELPTCSEYPYRFFSNSKIKQQYLENGSLYFQNEIQKRLYSSLSDTEKFTLSLNPKIVNENFSVIKESVSIALSKGNMTFNGFLEMISSCESPEEIIYIINKYNRMLGRAVYVDLISYNDLNDNNILTVVLDNIKDNL